MKVERQVSANFSPHSALVIFSPKQKEQRHKQLGCTDKMVTTKIKKLDPLSNFKIQQ